MVSVADESELAETWPEWSRPVAAGTWATATPLSQSPWSYPLESQLLDLPTTGWHNYRIPIGSSNASRLTIYQSRYVELLGYVLLVGVAGIAAAFLRRRTRWMLLAIGCFTAVTLLCPLEWVPVARGVLLGLALGLTWTAVQRIPRLSRPLRSYESSIATPLSTRGLGATAVQVLLLIFAAVLAARTAFSAEATATPTPARPSAEPQPAATAAEKAAPPVTPAMPATPSPERTDPQSQEPYALVSPVDDQGQPTGGYVYMPRAFYEALHKISASPRLSSQSWLIQSAAYRVTLNSADPAVELGESPRILAEYDAAVLEAGTSIELPLSRAEVTVLDAMLDGQAVPPLWDEAGTSLSFAVESPRQVRISLVLRPRMQTSERSFELAMSIPPVPRSSLVVQAASLESVEVPGARGSVQRDASRQEITADLGPADRLVVRWPIPGAVTTTAPEVSVSQLLLLRVHPNSVVLDTRFDFQIQSGVLQHVELLTDSRLQLLPLSPGSPVRQHEIQPGSLQRIRLDLDRPHTGELTIRASFLVSDVRGVGILTPPHVEVNARRSGPEWLAAWVAPGLAVPPPSDPHVAAQALAEFQSLWGGLDVTPQYVTRINPSESPPSISVEPVTSRTESREALDVSVSLDQVTLAFRAALNMRTGAFLQQRLTIPANLTVDDVQLSRDGVSRVLRGRTMAAER